MSRQVSNVDIITDSFEIFILKQNELLNALSTEIITANGTYSNTGSVEFPRVSQLYGTFGSNNLVVTDSLRGGNVTTGFTNLNVSTNVSISNSSISNVNISVSNTISNSYMNSVGAQFGNTNIFSAANNTVIGIYNQSANVRSIVNTSLISIGNSDISTNVTSSTIRSGLFVANQTAIHYGSNTTLNANSLNIKSLNSNSHIDSDSLIINGSNSRSSIVSSELNIEDITNNTETTVNASLISIGNSSAFTNISSVDVKSGLFVANQTAIHYGSNTTLDTDSLIISSSESETNISSSSWRIGNNTNSSSINKERVMIGNSTTFSTSNSTLVTVSEASSNTRSSISINGFITGNSSVFTETSSSAIKSGLFVANQTAIHYGSNTTLDTKSFSIDGLNTTVNINARSFSIGNTSQSIISNNTGYYINVGANTTSYQNRGYEYKNIFSQITEHKLNLGSNSSSREIFSFNKNNFTSGKLQVQIVNGSKTQLSEILLTHDGTDVEITTYGSVASPPSSSSNSPLGTFDANMNGSTVSILLNQVTSNSSTITIANMIV